MFGIDINNLVRGGNSVGGNIYSCIIIYTCCDMCSSCIVDYSRCVPSQCEV